MSTRNFQNENASKIFAVKLMDDYPSYNEDLTEEENEESNNGWDYDDLQEVIIERLGALAVDNHLIHFYKGQGKDSHENRSYGSNVLGTLTRYREYKGFDIAVNVVAIIRGAYYDGCNLDYDYSFSVGSDNGYDEIDFKEGIEWEIGSEKMVEYKAPLAEKWAKKAFNDLVEKLEAIYENISTPLNLVGTFSNGEGVYELANTERGKLLNAVK